MNWVNTGSANGLSPVRRQAITGTSADLFIVYVIRMMISVGLSRPAGVTPGVIDHNR